MCILPTFMQKEIQFYRTRKKGKNKNYIEGLDTFFTCRHFFSLTSFPHLTFECCYRPFRASLTMQMFLKTKRKRKEFWWLFCFSLISRASFLMSYNRRCKNKVVPCCKRSWFGAELLVWFNLIDCDKYSTCISTKLFASVGSGLCADFVLVIGR